MSDCEYILVHDGSTDDLVAITREAAAADPRIRLLHTSGKGGPAVARNLAVENHVAITSLS